MAGVVGIVFVESGRETFPGGLAPARELFDAIVAVDDGLDAAARARLRAEPLVARVLAPDRQDRALDTAVALGAKWMVVLRADERLDLEDAEALREFLVSDAVPGCAFGLKRYRTWDERTHDPGFTWAYRVFAPKSGQRLCREDPHPIPSEIPLAARMRTTVRMRAIGAARGVPLPGAPRWRARSPARPVLGSPAGTRDLEGAYDGALTWRCGRPMRPDVGEAFDALAAAALREAGLVLWVSSAFRSDEEQALMCETIDDPAIVAPAGASLHRYATELDLGPQAAYAWLERRAATFGFRRRYAWEPWHYGYGPVPEHADRWPRRDRPARVVKPAIVARAEWGADESLRFGADGRERWPEERTPVRGIVLHHTVTPNDEDDVLRRLQSIYRFHAVERDWGDVGYHLIVDEAGRVYEGRHGTLAAQRRGEGIVGAHAHGFNRGSIGIALLGTLSDRDATPQARASLEAVLAWLSTTLQIDPLATVTWPRVGTARVAAGSICAHRDLAEVVCPGDAFYATLPSLRAAVADGVGLRPARAKAAASAA